MNQQIPVHVLIDGNLSEWLIKVDGDGPWSLRLESPAGEEASAQGDNVYEALRSIRGDLSPSGVTLCINGARIDARPSPLSASHGAWMVYILRLWRPPTVRDLAPVFAYSDASRIGSVDEQDEYWQHHLRRRTSRLNLVNPIWWIYFLTSSWGSPKGR